MSTSATPAPIGILGQENIIVKAIQTGSPELTTDTSNTTPPQIAPAPPKPRQNAFVAAVSVSMPPDGITIAGTKWYRLSEIAKHTNISIATLRRRCMDGSIKYINKPLDRRGTSAMFLVSAEELRRVLSEGC